MEKQQYRRFISTAIAVSYTGIITVFRSIRETEYMGFNHKFPVPLKTFSLDHLCYFIVRFFACKPQFWSCFGCLCFWHSAGACCPQLHESTPFDTCRV